MGVGRVTRPGLDQPVGEAAINHVPREMILRQMEEVRRKAGYLEGLRVEISVPAGEELAKGPLIPGWGSQGAFLSWGPPALCAYE